MAKPGEGMPPAVLEVVRGVPHTDEVLAEVVERIGLLEISRDEIADRFDLILLDMMRAGLSVLRLHQAAVMHQLVKLYLAEEARDPERALTYIEKGFTSLGNQRKKRAGVHMEKSVKWLLDRCGIESELASLGTGQCDLVVPNARTLHERPERAVVLEIKHTTRERWKEVRDEVARTGRQVWLLTLDDYISNDNVALIGAGRITFYVPDRVFMSLDNKVAHLRSLRTLIRDLDPFGHPGGVVRSAAII